MAKAAPITAANVDDTGPSAVRQHHLHPSVGCQVAAAAAAVDGEPPSSFKKQPFVASRLLIFPPGALKDLFVFRCHDSVMHGGAAVMMRDFKPICAKKHKTLP